MRSRVSCPLLAGSALGGKAQHAAHSTSLCVLRPEDPPEEADPKYMGL